MILLKVAMISAMVMMMGLLVWLRQDKETPDWQMAITFYMSVGGFAVAFISTLISIILL